MKRIFLAMLLVLVAMPVVAETGWRGDGTGRAPTAEPCLLWTAKTNVLWKVNVGSSYSSPVPVADRVFLTSEEDKLLCVNRKTGKILWEHTNGFSDLTPKTKAPEDTSPTSCGFTTPTPVADGSHVYVLFGTGIVASYDFEGQRQWIRYLAEPQILEYGRSASPVLVAGKLVVMIGHLTALDAATGKTAWEVTDAAETYGTPVITKLGDTPVVITPNGVVVRATDGKVLARGIGEVLHSSPIVQDGVVFFGDAHSTAVKLTLKPDGKAETRELWQADLEGEFYASPVWHDGLLYTVSNAGALQALAAATGKTIYQQTLEIPSGNFYGSLVVAGGKLFVSNDKGNTLVVTPGKEFKSIQKNSLDDGAASTPMFDGRALFLRAGDLLYAISAP